MIDLYISRSIYDEYSDLRMENTNLYQLLHNNAVTIYIADEDNAEFDTNVKKQLNDSQRSEGRFLSDSNGEKSPKSGKDMIDCLKNPNITIEVGLSKALLILDVEDDVKSITSRYGIPCLTGDDIEVIDQLKNHKRLFYIKDKECETTWDMLSSKFSKLPSHSFIISDHYLDCPQIKNNEKDFVDCDHCKYDYWNCNMKNLLSNLINQSNGTQLATHLMIICGRGSKDENKKDYYADKIFVYIRTVLIEIAKKMKHPIIVEFIYCDDAHEKNNTQKRDELYFHTHDRFICSNIYNIEATKTLNAFRWYKDKETKEIKTKSKESQTINIFGLFCFGFEDQDEEEVQAGRIDLFAKDFEHGTGSEIDGNNRRWYEAYEINPGGSCRQINTGDNVKIINRLIMDRFLLKEGDLCKYLNVPMCNDWLNIDISRGVYESLGKYANRIVVKGDTKTLTTMIDEIKKIFNEHTCEQVTDEKGLYYKIVTATPSDLKTIHVIPSKSVKKSCTQYNCFKNIEEAMKIANEMANIIGIKAIYSDEAIKSSKMIISRNAFFNPWCGKDDFLGKKFLIVDASHNCTHTHLQNDNAEKCPYFCNCTNCDYKTGHSRVFNTLCKYATKGDGTSYTLEETTRIEVENFINGLSNNPSIFNFTRIMQEILKEIKNEDYTQNNWKDEKTFINDFWNKVSFVTYGQNFESQKEKNHFYPKDYEAFKSYLNDIKPDVVILWGDDIDHELTKYGFKKDTENGGYWWEMDNVIYINCYHPSIEKSIVLEDGKLKDCLSKVFN